MTACQELKGCSQDTACALVMLRDKWNDLLKSAPNDPKLIEFNETYVQSIIGSGVELVSLIQELENSIRELHECGAGV